MLIGVPREIKNHEYRVGMTPASVREAVLQGHDVVIETSAGVEIGFTDQDYQAVGAKMVGDADEVFARADLVVKVKEPQASECRRLRSGQILFTYLHLAPDLAQTKALIDSDCIAIAYETVTDNRGGLPLLAPMSEVAGRMAIQAGAHCLEKTQGGRGTLLGGVPGVPPAKVLVLGGGVVGTNALSMAVGLGAQVVVIDRSLERLRVIDLHFGNAVQTVHATGDAIQRQVKTADLVIGAVLVPGAAAPKLVTREMLKGMRRGSVLVDVAIDQGGCFETARPTTHDDPIYLVDGVVHYCVANMPGAVPLTSTLALNSATLPYILALANHGVVALSRDPHLRNGLNVHRGRITSEPVARAHGLPHIPAQQAIEV